MRLFSMMFRYNPLNYVTDLIRSRIGDRGLQGVRVLYRTSRVVVLGFGLYNLGYMAGIAEYAIDPGAQEKKFIEQILRGNGGKQLIKERTSEYQRVQHISKDIVRTARDFALMKCRELSVLDRRFKMLHGDKYKSIVEAANRDEKENSEKKGNNVLSRYTTTYVPKPTAITSMASISRALEERPSPSSSSTSTNDTATVNLLSKDMQKLCKKVGVLPHSFGDDAKFAVPNNHLSLTDVRQNSETIKKVYQMDKLIHQQERGKEINIGDVNAKLWQEYSFWYSTYHRMKGDWTVVLMDCPQPNAMVTPLLNRKIIVHLPLVQLLDCDELAFVIAHECSHYILEHGKAQMGQSLFWEILALIVASLFALEELLILEYFTTHYFRKASESSHSQQSEHEADHLGVVIAGKACYDVQKGIAFFGKMGQWEEEAAAAVGEKRAAPSWNATHPPHETRLEKCKAHIGTIKKSPSFYNQDCSLVRQTFGFW